MRNLTPDHLLVRQTPVDDDRWGEANEGKIEQKIRLERFQELEQTLRNNPAYSEPYIELAKIYLSLKRWTDAKRVLDRAAEQFSDDDQVMYLREDAQLARALQLMQIAEHQHQTEPTRLTEEAWQRTRIELNVVREKVCRARLQRQPDQVELLLPLAHALRELGKIGEAVASLQQTVKIPSLRAEAALELGQLFAQESRIPEALSAYRRAALYRVPPPAARIRKQALELAADLAEKYKLIDSARRYVDLLLVDDPSNAQLLERAARLRETPL